ncbi:MAG: lipid-binding protein [Paludibacteraceae bacterium]
MKKVVYGMLMLCAVLLASCEKEEIGGTAVESLSGQWYVHVDAIDLDGSVWAEDPYGLGNILLLTYNTNANDADSLIVDDLAYFWEFKVTVPCALSTGTFGWSSSEKSSTNLVPDYGIQVPLWEGKILKGAATTPSGMPADSIVFNVLFEDDTNPADYGFSHYQIAGYRYTGLAADE